MTSLKGDGIIKVEFVIGYSCEVNIIIIKIQLYLTYICNWDTISGCQNNTVSLEDVMSNALVSCSFSNTILSVVEL